jgi:hypothetical protein
MAHWDRRRARFVSAGASVILGDLNPVQLRRVAWLNLDFTDQTQVRGLVNEIINAGVIALYGRTACWS